MRIWKEVIRPGEYFYLDDSGQPRKFVATPEDVSYWHQSGKSMLSAGLSIPIPLEHQRDAKPLTPSEKAAQQLLHNTGFVDDFRVMPGSRLLALCNIEDEEIYRKLPRTIRWTSPWFNSFTDGDGRSWQNVISHLALTNRPRITAQNPFGSEEAALSLVAPTTADSRSTLTTPGGAFLSRAGLLTSQTGRPVPRFPAAFSIWSGVRLADDFPPRKDDKPPEKKEPPAGEGKKDDKPPPEKKPPGEGKEGKEGTSPPMADDLTLPLADKKMEMVDIAAELMEALFGVELPPGTDEKNLLEHMLRAMMDHLKKEMGNEDMAAPGTPPPSTPPPAAPGTPTQPVQESPPLFMSLEEVQRITDPATRKMAEACLSIQAKSQAMEARTLKQASDYLERRVHNIASRLPPHARDTLLAQTKGVRLSLNADGTVNNPMELMLSILESSIPDVPALLTANPGHIGTIDHPRDQTGPMSDDRAQQIADRMCEQTGLTPRKAS